jgi:hypothetical protein
MHVVAITSPEDWRHRPLTGTHKSPAHEAIYDALLGRMEDDRVQVFQTKMSKYVSVKKCMQELERAS